MTELAPTVYHTYRVRFLARAPVTPTATKDPVNNDYWICDSLVPAQNEDAALKQIIVQGHVPVSAKFVRPSGGYVPSDYKLKLIMAIMFAVQSGDSVGSALEKTIDGEQWPLRGRLDPALRMLRAGASFTEAIAIIGLYDETTLAILGAGEQTGTMQQALSTALQHLQRKSTAENMMKGAVGMILIDIMMAMSSSVTAVFGLLPQAESQGLQTEDKEMLAAWEQAIQIGYWSNGILMAGACIALFFAFIGWAAYEYGSPKAREKVAGYLRKMPFLGAALLHDGVSVSTSIAGHLLKGGVLFTSALEVTARAVRLPTVKQYWQQALAMTMVGTPTTTALARDPMTLAERRVLASHTNSEQLAEALTQISQFRQEQASKANKHFIVMGLVGSFLYSAMGIASTLYVNYIQITAIMASSGM